MNAQIMMRPIIIPNISVGGLGNVAHYCESLRGNSISTSKAMRDNVEILTNPSQFKRAEDQFDSDRSHKIFMIGNGGIGIGGCGQGNHPSSMNGGGDDGGNKPKKLSGGKVDQINIENRYGTTVNVRTAGIQDAAAIADIIGAHKRYGAELKLNTKRSDNGFLMANMTQEQVGNVINNEPAVLVAEINNQIAGFVVATYPRSNRYEDLRGCRIKWYDQTSKERYMAQDYLYLWMVGVDDRFRGKGIATRLLSRLGQQALQLQYKAIISDIMLTPVFNVASDALFRKNNYGYSGVLTIDDYYGCGPSKWKIYSHQVVHTIDNNE